MKPLFAFLTIAHLFFLMLFIYGFLNPKKALFWLKINKEKTKNLSHYINGGLFLVFLIASLVIFEVSGLRAEKQKEDAQLQVQTAIEKEKADNKNKKISQKQIKEPPQTKKENIEVEKKIILPKYEFLEKRQMRGGGVYSFVLVNDTTLCTDIYLELIDNLQNQVRDDDKYTEDKFKNNYNFYLYSSKEKYTDDHKTSKSVPNLYFFGLEGIWDGQFRRNDVKYNYGHIPSIKNCK